MASDSGYLHFKIGLDHKFKTVYTNITYIYNQYGEILKIPILQPIKLQRSFSKAKLKQKIGFAQENTFGM